MSNTGSLAIILYKYEVGSKSFRLVTECRHDTPVLCTVMHIFAYWTSPASVTHVIFFIVECSIVRFLCAVHELCVYSMFGHHPQPQATLWLHFFTHQFLSHHTIVWAGYKVYSAFLFLYGNGFLSRDFTDQHEILQVGSATSQTGLLPLWGRQPQGWPKFGHQQGAVWRDMLLAEALVLY